jgi:hypothetical protein
MRRFALVLGVAGKNEKEKSTVKWLGLEEPIKTSVRLVDEDNESRKIA